MNNEDNRPASILDGCGRHGCIHDSETAKRAWRAGQLDSARGVARLRRARHDPHRDDFKEHRRARRRAGGHVSGPARTTPSSKSTTVGGQRPRRCRADVRGPQRVPADSGFQGSGRGGDRHASVLPRGASRGRSRSRQACLLRETGGGRCPRRQARARDRQAGGRESQPGCRLPDSHGAAICRAGEAHPRRRAGRDRVRCSVLLLPAHRSQLSGRFPTGAAPAQLAAGPRTVGRYHRRAEHPRHRHLQLGSARPSG